MNTRPCGHGGAGVVDSFHPWCFVPPGNATFAHRATVPLVPGATFPHARRVSLSIALDRVRQAPLVVDVLRMADELADTAARDGGGGAAVRRLAVAIDDPGDGLTAVAAVHAMARLFDDEADAVLSALLSHDRSFLREHAAWALSRRLPRLDAIGRLAGVVADGGFSGMLAQRTLEQWSRSASDHVALAVEGALAGAADVSARARLVETLGLVPGAVAGRVVREVAGDVGRPTAVRLAAVAALGDRPGDAAGAELVRELCAGDDELAAVARLAADDLGLAGPGVPRQGDGPDPTGLRIAQLFLHADIDTGLTRAGAGDNGGVATMLVRLGDALAARPEVASVLTLSRGTARAAVQALEDGGRGHVLVPVPLLADPVGAADAWPVRVAAERAVRRVLRRRAPVDVLHLRMADVGSMAAATVARRAGVPVVFTLAPDPHAVIHALDMTGGLRRDNFGTVDGREHYWFRARLVQRLAADAAHNVLFPRPELRHDLRELLGVDVEQEPGRFTVVPEGIDLSVVDTAAASVGSSPAAAELARLVAALPPARHGLPLAVSVGRLHRVKGMATVVEAWASDPALVARANLVVVGGDLAAPSTDERLQLDLIADVLARHPGAADGLVLAGHRPHDVVASWLAVARHGDGSTVGADGVYVCASLKEEFGLAILEALAAGLVVVAPAGGGPATYVEHGRTGVLVDTSIPARVAAGIGTALDLAVAPDRAEGEARAVALVRERFTVQAMAAALSSVYAGVTADADGRVDDLHP